MSFMVFLVPFFAIFTFFFVITLPKGPMFPTLGSFALSIAIVVFWQRFTDTGLGFLFLRVGAIYSLGRKGYGRSRRKRR